MNPVRYSIQHPLLTPELYSLMPANTHTKVRGLQIYQDRNQSPDVILDSSADLKSQVFNGIGSRCLHFKSGFHMYISHLQGYLIMGENVLATYLMRQHFLLDFGACVPDTIYGDVLVFGTGSTNRDYSVPYEVVEQLIHLYEKI